MIHIYLLFHLGYYDFIHEIITILLLLLSFCHYKQGTIITFK